MRYIILEKISDDMFNGNHPNGVNVGCKIEGFDFDGIKVGESLILYNANGSKRAAWTSVVKEFDKDNKILKTNNSTYKIIINEID